MAMIKYMHYKFKPLIILLLIIIFFCVNVYAQDEKSSMTTSYNYSNGISFIAINPNDSIINPNDPYATSGVDDIKPFWEAPLSMQTAYITATAFLSLGALLALPFVWGRLKHVLENPKTREIFNFIQRNPGVTIAELSKRQQINRGTLKYHLSQLLAENKIAFIKKGKFARVFRKAASKADMETLIAIYLKNESSKRILFTIMDNPGISNKELSDMFEMAKSTTHEYLKKMSDDDILEFRQEGKYRRCYIRQDARMILLKYKAE